MSLSPITVEDRLEEARWIAREVATLLDIPCKEPVLADSLLKSAFVNTSEKFILAPELVRELDDEEFLFWTTYQCVIGLAAQEVWDENPRAQWWFLIKFCLCTQIVTGPVLAVKEISVLVAIAAGVLLTPLSLWLMVRLHLSTPPSISHRAFEITAQVTGLGGAGERMFRKSMAQERLKLSAARKAYLAKFYERSVPPQYRTT